MGGTLLSLLPFVAHSVCSLHGERRLLDLCPVHSQEQPHIPKLLWVRLKSTSFQIKVKAAKDLQLPTADMILPSKTAIAQSIITGLRDKTIQAQPCGVDLTLRHVLKWTSPGTIDFSNQFRAGAQTEKMPFAGGPKPIHLAAGSYLIEFNERVDMPLDIFGQVFMRSSLWRSGALLSAGVIDSGYKGGVGAMLQVVNPSGLVVHENARLAQMVFHEMREKTNGYDGVYQEASTVVSEH